MKLENNLKLNQELNQELNHPWFLYPRGFMSEYYNYSLYRSESIRLLNFINNLNNQIEINIFNEYKTLVSIILGSTIEDSLIKLQTNKSNYFQYRQLFPNYINNFINNISGKKNIQIIIISPDDFLSFDNYIPLFIKFTYYDFVKKNKYEYEHVIDNLIIKINIFNCPMPSFDNRNDYIKNQNTFLNNNLSQIFNIKNYFQSPIDIIFINDIYNKLEKLFSFNNNNEFIIVVNSWVSFKNLCGISENFNMFPQMLSLSTKYNIIATEWNFIDDIFSCKIISNFKYNNKYYQYKYIYYIDKDNEQISKESLKNNLNLIKNNEIYIIGFNYPNLLERVIN